MVKAANDQSQGTILSSYSFRKATTNSMLVKKITNASSNENRANIIKALRTNREIQELLKMLKFEILE